MINEDEDSNVAWPWDMSLSRGQVCVSFGVVAFMYSWLMPAVYVARYTSKTSPPTPLPPDEEAFVDYLYANWGEWNGLWRAILIGICSFLLMAIFFRLWDFVRANRTLNEHPSDGRNG